MLRFTFIKHWLTKLFKNNKTNWVKSLKKLSSQLNDESQFVKVHTLIFFRFYLSCRTLDRLNGIDFRIQIDRWIPSLPVSFCLVFKAYVKVKNPKLGPFGLEIPTALYEYPSHAEIRLIISISELYLIDHATFQGHCFALELFTRYNVFMRKSEQKRRWVDITDWIYSLDLK